MFDIYLTEEFVPELESGVEAVYGRIQIGDDYETFVASLVFWSPEQYERQWRASLRRIVTGADRSALITSFVEPVSEGSLTWWPLYRQQETVYVQNQLLFFDQLRSPFSVELPWESVGERKTVNSEGLQISEWVTTVQSIQECLNRKSKTITN